MRSPLPKLAALALTATLALPAGAAGAQGPEPAKPAGAIFAGSLAAMSHVSDFHVVGRIREGTQFMSLNLTMSGHGGGGNITVHGATIQMVVTRKRVYMKANAASWMALTHQEGVGQLLANRWLRAAASDPQLASFSKLAVSTQFLGYVRTLATRVSELGAHTWHGRPAIELRDGSGDQIYIAAVGTPYLLGVVSGQAPASGSLEFTDFGDAPMPAIPLKTITLPGL